MLFILIPVLNFSMVIREVYRIHNKDHVVVESIVRVRCLKKINKAINVEI